jgi:hypothetical protein
MFSQELARSTKDNGFAKTTFLLRNRSTSRIQKPDFLISNARWHSQLYGIFVLSASVSVFGLRPDVFPARYSVST